MNKYLIIGLVVVLIVVYFMMKKPTVTKTVYVNAGTSPMNPTPQVVATVNKTVSSLPLAGVPGVSPLYIPPPTQNMAPAITQPQGGINRLPGAAGASSLLTVNKTTTTTPPQPVVTTAPIRTGHNPALLSVTK